MPVTTTSFASMKVWNGLPGDFEGVDFRGVPFLGVFLGVVCVDLACEQTMDVASDSVSLSTGTQNKFRSWKIKGWAVKRTCPDITQVRVKNELVCSH